jgi:phage terminase large subunit-like protein
LAELERAIVGRKLTHGAHPILRFCFANAEAERNRQGHLTRLVKSRRWLSIDGAVAAAMAVGRAAVGEHASSILDAPDFNPSDLLVRL